MAESALDAGGEFSPGDQKQIRIPGQSIQREYMMSILLALRDFDSIIKNMQQVDDPRFKVMARQIVNRVLDDDKKYALLDAFDKKLKEIYESKDPADIQSMNVITASQDIVGEVNSYLDIAFALHKGQLIGDV